MLYLIFTSLFGLLIISRILSLLENSQLFSRKKNLIVVSFLIFPLFVFSIFKEPYIYFILYIGIILFLLTQQQHFFRFAVKNVYEKCHLRVLDMIILHMKAGVSPSQSLEYAIKDQSKDAQEVLACLFLNKDNKILNQQLINQEFEQFKVQINEIFNSRVQIVDRLKNYKRNLKIIFDLRRKSGAATLQSRWQAIISVCVYLILFNISWVEFELKKQPFLIAISVLLFLIGFFMVFSLGRKIKWTR